MSYNRRNFIKTSSLGAIAASTLSINCQNNLSNPIEGVYMGDFADKPIKKIRAAFIGLNRGGSHLRNFATIKILKLLHLVICMRKMLKENWKDFISTIQILTMLKHIGGMKISGK